MQIIPLYRYARPDGGITVSPIKPEGVYEDAFRLVADEGYILVNGDRNAVCIDVDSVEGWTEIPDSNSSDDEVADMKAALEVLGVSNK